MKKIIFLAIALMVISCGEPIEISDDQLQFTNTWRDFTEQHDVSGTKAQKSHWLNQGTDHINQKKAVQDWYGTVAEVGSALDGDYITVEYDGIQYYLYPKGEGIDYTKINLYDELLFSGRLNGNYWLDTFDEPGLYVDCTKITNIDKTHSYFIITEEELQEYLNDVAEKEEINEDLHKAFNELKEIFEDL